MGSDSNRGQYSGQQCALIQPWRRDQSSQQSTATYARFRRKKNKMREVYNAGTILLHVFFVDAPPPPHSSDAIDDKIHAATYGYDVYT